MSKILKNTTANIVTITDTGVSVPASPGQYVIPAQDYWMWAASDNVITQIGNGSIIVNDGSSNLSISDGTDFIKGIYQKNRIIGNTDGTMIDNVGDRLKVDASVTGTIIISPANIIKQNEVAVTVKVETDFPSSTYTVPSGKTFSVVTFGGSYDAQQPMYIRFKKQTGGTGSFVTVFRENLSVNGQDASNFLITVPPGLLIGAAGDIFKITYEPSVGRGTLFAAFTGIEK